MDELDFWWWAAAPAAARWRDGCRRIRTSRWRCWKPAAQNDNWVVDTPFAGVLMVRRQHQQLGVRHRAAAAASTAASAISRAARGSAARPRSTRWSISAATARTTTNGPRSATPAGRSPTCCPTSSASEDNADFDGEYHGKGGPLAVNKTAHRQSGAADLPAGGAGSPVSPVARISTPTSMKASASIR